MTATTATVPAEFAAIATLLPTKATPKTATAPAPVKAAPASPTRPAAKLVKRPLTVAQREARTRKTFRMLAIAGTLPVVVTAAYASYFHIVSLAVRHGQSESIGHMMPLPIDGMMIVAAVAVIAQGAARLPRVAFVVGAALTLAANILSVEHPDPIAYVIAAIPALALLLSAEMLLRLVMPTPTRRRRAAKGKTKTTKTTTTRTR